MDYAEVIIKLQIGVKDLHDAINKKDWSTVDIESDNIVFEFVKWFCHRNGECNSKHAKHHKFSNNCM